MFLNILDLTHCGFIGTIVHLHAIASEMNVLAGKWTAVSKFLFLLLNMLLCYKYISMLPHICLLMLIENILDRPKFEVGVKLTSNEYHRDRMKHHPRQE